jgi:hypothetical protein
MFGALLVFAVLAVAFDMTSPDPLRFDPTACLANLKELVADHKGPGLRSLFYYDHPLRLPLLLGLGWVCKFVLPGADFFVIIRSFNALCTAGAIAVLVLAGWTTTRKALPWIAAGMVGALAWPPFFLTTVREDALRAYLAMPAALAMLTLEHRLQILDRHPVVTSLAVGLPLGLLSVSHVTQNATVVVVLGALALRPQWCWRALLRSATVSAVVAAPLWTVAPRAAGVHGPAGLLGLFEEQRDDVADLATLQCKVLTAHG